MSDDLAITQLVPGKDDMSAIMAAIGHVCVQWSLLENNILGILAALENIPVPQAAIMFGGMDMKPRLGTAINLAEYHKIHPPLLKRLRNLRAAIEKAKLKDRRNIVVHGVHKASDKPHTFTLYMPRLKGSAQHTEVSIMDAYQLGMEIKAAGDEAWSIFEDYGKWRFPDHRPENGGGEFVAAPPRSLALRLKQYLRSRADHLLRRFK